jgi:YHS domain-containing protein
MASSGKKKNQKNELEELVQDPYCKTYIPRTSAFKKKVGGQVLYFCCESCLKSYLRGEVKNSA